MVYDYYYSRGQSYQSSGSTFLSSSTVSSSFPSDHEESSLNAMFHADKPIFPDSRRDLQVHMRKKDSSDQKRTGMNPSQNINEFNPDSPKRNKNRGNKDSHRHVHKGRQSHKSKSRGLDCLRSGPTMVDTESISGRDTFSEYENMRSPLSHSTFHQNVDRYAPYIKPLPPIPSSSSNQQDLDDSPIHKPTPCEKQSQRSKESNRNFSDSTENQRRKKIHQSQYKYKHDMKASQSRPLPPPPPPPSCEPPSSQLKSKSKKKSSKYRDRQESNSPIYPSVINIPVPVSPSRNSHDVSDSQNDGGVDFSEISSVTSLPSNIIHDVENHSASNKNSSSKYSKYEHHAQPSFPQNDSSQSSHHHLNKQRSKNRSKVKANKHAKATMIIAKDDLESHLSFSSSSVSSSSSSLCEEKHISPPLETNIELIASNQRSKALQQIMAEMEELYEMRSKSTKPEDLQFWDSQIKSLQQSIYKICEVTAASAAKHGYHHDSLSNAPLNSSHNSPYSQRHKKMAQPEMHVRHGESMSFNNQNHQHQHSSRQKRFEFPEDDREDTYDIPCGEDYEQKQLEKTVKVRAPADLPGGHSFVARMKNKSIIAVVVSFLKFLHFRP